MKALPLIICTALLLTTAPLRAGSWADNLIDWVYTLFVDGDQRTDAAAAYPTVRFDSLATTPLGSVLLPVVDSDTCAVNTAWPPESLTVEYELSVYQTLLRQTVVLANPNATLPLLGMPRLRIVYHPDQRPDRLLNMARRFADVQEVAYTPTLPGLLTVAEDMPTVLVTDERAGPSATGTSPTGPPLPVTDWFRPLTERLGFRTALIHFGKPTQLSDLPADWAVLTCPRRSRQSEDFIAQALFGAQLLDGRTSAATADYPAGSGERLEEVTGGFRPPELLGIDRTAFGRVDYQIERGIRYRAMPGAQLVVMKDGHVVYEKAYGHHVYRKQEVDPGDLYDLASVTKAASTSLAVMKLYDQGRIDLKTQVREYLPELRKRMIGRYTVEQLLSHHTGLQSDLPLEKFIGRQFVADEACGEYTIPVGPDHYLDETIPGKIRKRLKGKIGRTRRLVYRYSDLNYYLLQLAVEAIAGQPIDAFMEQSFYQPLGLGKLGFRPADDFPAQRLVPTVYDPWMRGGLLRGYVHDEGAALLGGVAGHAGLFGNARQLAILFQLLNNGGSYAGYQLLEPATVALFTHRNRYNYRALGFDRLAGGWPRVVNAGASDKTFGHVGFAGTAVWADPEKDLVFVLLTNRVFPDAKSKKFQQLQIRSRVHEAVYGTLDTWEVES